MKPAKPAPARSSITAAQWRDAVVGSATEVAQQALSFTGARLDDAPPAVPVEGRVGAHIPLVGGGGPYELCLLGTREACETLARAILMMGPTEAITPRTMADAVGEIVNMLAGGVKRRLGAATGDLALGLPVFVNGSAVVSDHQSAIEIPLRMGALAVAVTIVGGS